MTRYICDLVGGGDNSLLASVRLAKEIARHTTIPLLTPKMLKSSPKGFLKADLLVIPNLPKLLIREVDLWDEVVATAKHVIWVQNDYNIWAPSPKTEGKSVFTRGFTARNEKQLPTEVWSSCPTRIDESYGTYVNWNALQYLPQTSVPKKRIKQMLYYGAFRKGRATRFSHFFDELSALTISAPRTATERFKELCARNAGNITYAEPFKDNLIQQIAAYAVGLYAEDALSTRQYHSPANRLYEMISAQQAIAVDVHSVSTLEKGGFPVKAAWTVQNAADCESILANATKIAREQQALWAPVAKAQHAALIKKIKSIRRI